MKWYRAKRYAKKMLKDGWTVYHFFEYRYELKKIYKFSDKLAWDIALYMWRKTK